MLELHWSQADIDAVTPERRERLLWGLYAARLLAAQERVLSIPMDRDASTRRGMAITRENLVLFPAGG